MIVVKKDMLLTEEILGFQDSLRGFLAKNCSRDLVRSQFSAGSSGSKDLWRKAVNDLGLSSMCLPAEFGGDGGDGLARTIVLEELGAALAPVPYLASCVFGAEVAARVDVSSQRSTLLEGIAAGRVCCVAFAEGADPAWLSAAATTRADSTGAGSVLNGAKSFVLGAEDADWFIVSAVSARGPRLYVVEAGADGLTVTRASGADLTRSLSLVGFASTPAVELACVDVEGAVSGARDEACIALGAEMVGGIDRCVELAAAHARTRYQFGRAIGSFQAVKHICANMRVKAELARAAVFKAVSSVDEQTHSLDALVVAATVGRMYREIASDMLHVHGGLGFTWEHDAHLYLRRAISTSLMLGSEDNHLDRLVQRLGWRAAE